MFASQPQRTVSVRRSTEFSGTRIEERGMAMFEIEYEVCREDINGGKPVIDTVVADSEGTLEYELGNLERAGLVVVAVLEV